MNIKNCLIGFIKRKVKQSDHVNLIKFQSREEATDKSRLFLEPFIGRVNSVDFATAEIVGKAHPFAC